MDKKLDFYESLIRLSLALIFVVALAAGTFGVISIFQMLMHAEIPRPELTSRYLE